ncbi:hypothetical protein V6N11_081262 [Hibiscus sabdariffa]|uniref:RNase H type-1 domain-containing protein n=1 Tax=Hibiscus sabdariffa TaxID=183260 RepID=A0ABR2QJA0_9ROSI
MISNLGEWDWERLEHHLPISALESLVAIQPPKPEYGIDVPGWREKFWKGPDPDWVKVNVDTSVDAVGNRAVTGGFIRDDSGGWLTGFYRCVGRCSVLLAELWTIYDGLNHVWDAGFQRVAVEYDNKEAVCIINRMSLTLDRSVLVQSIWALMQRDWLVKVCHVLREENAAADKLAALGKGCGLNGSIFVVPPGAVASIVEHDQRRWMQWLLQWRGIPPSVARFHFAYLYYWFVVSSRCEMV